MRLRPELADPVSEFFQQIINGLSLGSIYALIALGYTMVYGILKLINFAHGEVFMVGAYAGYSTARRWLGVEGYEASGAGFPLVFALARARASRWPLRRCSASRSSGSRTARCARRRA